MLLKLAKHEMVILATLTKASKEGGLRVDCKSPSAATAARAQAYALGKKIRKYSEKTPGDLDACEIVETLDSVSMSLEEGWLVIKRKDQFAGLLAMQALLDQAGVPVVDPMEREMEESLRRMQERLESSDDQKKG